MANRSCCLLLQAPSDPRFDRVTIIGRDNRMLFTFPDSPISAKLLGPFRLTGDPAFDLGPLFRGGTPLEPGGEVEPIDLIIVRVHNHHTRPTPRIYYADFMGPTFWGVRGLYLALPQRFFCQKCAGQRLHGSPKLVIHRLWSNAEEGCDFSGLESTLVV